MKWEKRNFNPNLYFEDFNLITLEYSCLIFQLSDSTSPKTMASLHFYYWATGTLISEFSPFALGQELRLWICLAPPFKPVCLHIFAWLKNVFVFLLAQFLATVSLVENREAKRALVCGPFLFIRFKIGDLPRRWQQKAGKRPGEGRDRERHLLGMALDL